MIIVMEEASYKLASFYFSRIDNVNHEVAMLVKPDVYYEKPKCLQEEGNSQNIIASINSKNFKKVEDSRNSIASKKSLNIDDVKDIKNRKILSLIEIIYQDLNKAKINDIILNPYIKSVKFIAESDFSEIVHRCEYAKEEYVLVAAAENEGNCVANESSYVSNDNNYVANTQMQRYTTSLLIETAVSLGIAYVSLPEYGSEYAIESIDEIDIDYLETVRRRRHSLPCDIGLTKRCYIRELAISDLRQLYEMYEKNGESEFVEPLYEYDKEVEYELSYIKYMYGFYGYGMWIVFDRESGKLIGRAGLEHREIETTKPQNTHEIEITKSQVTHEIEVTKPQEPLGIEAKEQLNILEMGYMIDPDFRRRGYAREVCEFIIDYAWEKTEFEELNCIIHDNNTISKKFAESLGFKYLETLYIEDVKMCRYIIRK